MYIVDGLDKIHNKYKYNKIVAKWLVAHKIPILSKTDGYYFANTQRLRETLSNAPFYIKLIK